MKRTILKTVVVVLALVLLAEIIWVTSLANREEETLQAPSTTEAVPTTVVSTEATTQPPATVPVETTAPTTAPTTEPQPEVFTLTFAGDCTFGSTMANWYAPYGFILTVGDNYDYPFQNVLEYFENDDFTMVNLEGPLCDEGNPVQKKHTFHGPTSYVNHLTENSIEAVTIANNHSYDYGKNGYTSTVQALEGAGVPYVAENSSTIVTTESGLTIGIYAAVYNTWDMEDMRQEIAVLVEEAELVIYAVHWGTEGSYRPVKSQVDLAHELIDMGVDIIYGSHPHVLQNVEEYNGGIIYYSLGNFCFGGNLYPQDLDSAVLQQTVIREPDGTVHLGELTMIPCSVSSVPIRNNFQPTPFEEGTEDYERAMSKLTGTFKGYNLTVG